MDKELIVENIESDYKKALAAFSNAKRLYELRNQLTEDEKNDVIEKLAESGEKVLKYIINLYEFYYSPNQTYEKFRKNHIYMNSGNLNRFVNDTRLIPQNERDSKLEPIRKYPGEQPAHDFSKAYLIIKTLFPKQILNIAHIFSSCESKRILEGYYPNTTPKIFNYIKNIDNEDISQFMRDYYYYFTHNQEIKDINIMMDNRESSINHNGDAFVRLRYFDMNPSTDYKTYDIDEMFLLVNDLIVYAKSIHCMNNDINCNIGIAYIKQYALEIYKDTSKIEFIEEVYKLSNIIKDFKVLRSCIFATKLSLDDLKFYNNLDLDDYDRYLLIEHNINESEYVLLMENGIVDIASIIKAKNEYGNINQATIDFMKSNKKR